MELIKPGINIDFVGKRKLAFAFSGILILASLVLLIWRGGPNYGVDFTGGTLVQVKLGQKESPSAIKMALKPIQLEDSVIQEFGEQGQSEYLIRVTRTDIDSTGLGEKIRAALEKGMGSEVEIRRVEMVGPQVGSELREKALLAIFYSILLMAIYISGRFEFKWVKSIIMAAALAPLVAVVASGSFVSIAWIIVLALIVTLALCWFLDLKYALGAIVALIHDVIVTVGVFSLMDKEFSLSFVAAILTIVGFSVNDTIIIFDRIRENLKRFRRKPLEEVMNSAINETLSRTIITSGTAILVLLALFFLGGGVIHDFAFALLVGFTCGVYSTVYIASPILLLWEGKPGQNDKKKA